MFWLLIETEHSFETLSYTWHLTKTTKFPLLEAGNFIVRANSRMNVTTTMCREYRQWIWLDACGFLVKISVSPQGNLNVVEFIFTLLWFHIFYEILTPLLVRARLISFREISYTITELFRYSIRIAYLLFLFIPLKRCTFLLQINKWPSFLKL